MSFLFLIFLQPGLGIKKIIQVNTWLSNHLGDSDGSATKY